MLYYFAYGSNMSPKQMARRCPGAQPVGHGFLPEWRYMTNTKGTANIHPSSDDTVHGVLWRCTPRHIAILDRYEGVRLKHYLKKRTVVKRPGDLDCSAIVYISERNHYGRARADYMHSAVLPGARAFGLPQDYIEELTQWIPRNAIGKSRMYFGRKVMPVDAA